jgi:hypothetical protein
MAKTLRSVSKGYAYNTNHKLDPRKYESIIRLLEDSRDYLSKACAVHIVITLENNDFDVRLINETLSKLLNKMNVRIWLLHST